MNYFKSSIAIIIEDGKFYYYTIKIDEYSHSYGIIDETDKKIIECKYGIIEYLGSGLFKVCKDGWGIIDITGKIVIECKYDYIYDFKNGFFNVELNGEQFWINKNETIKIKEMKL